MGGEGKAMHEELLFGTAPATAAAMTSVPEITVTVAAPSNNPSTSPKTSPSTSPKRSPRQQEPYYWVKHTSFLQRNVSYICQNVNGPCPLLAICNVLLLRGHVSIDEYLHTSGPSSYIFARDVVAIVENRLVHTNRNFNEAERVLLNEVVALLQTLQVGLDVNVQFHDINAFEYTNACAIFDLLDMRLVHGWVVDPQDTAAYSLLAHKSYNQIVDRLIDYHSMQAASKEQSIPALMKERSLSMDDAAVKVHQIATEGPIIDAFLADSASQLTYIGLIRLHEDLKERELAVFFRNNHFSTIFKYEGALYLLVTDTGYYDEPHVIWEKLEQIDGDSEYHTMAFTPLVGETTKQQELLQKPPTCPARPPSPVCVEAPVVPVPAPPSPPRPAATVPPSTPPLAPSSTSPVTTLEDDFALALKLQEEENAALSLAHQAHRSSPRGVANSGPSDSRRPPSPRGPTVPQVAPSIAQEAAAPGNATEGDDHSLLNLTHEELQMQREAELYYNQQRQRQLGQQPSYGASGQRQDPPRQQRRQASTDNCTMM